MNYLSKLSRSIVDCVVHILTWNSVVVGGDQLWRGGTAYSAVDGPSGRAITVPWMVWGDQVFCYGWSGGTTFGGDHLEYDKTSSNFQLLYEHDCITSDAAFVRLQGLYLR